MKTTREILEVNQTLAILRKYAVSSCGKKMIDELDIYTYQGELEDELEFTREALSYLIKYQSLTIFPLQDLSDDLIRIHKRASVELNFFYQVARLLDNVSNLKNDSDIDDNFPLLKGLLNQLEPNLQLKKEIEMILTPDLEISSTASSKLASIRRAIQIEEQSQASLMSNLMRRYQSYLNDERIALKNNSRVLAIKSSYKGKVEGIVVAVSSTGQTVFIEPNEILISNNKINRLKEQEQEEIARIIKELTANVLANYSLLSKDNYLIGRLDFLMAKGQFAKEYDALVGHLSKERQIKLIGARHPLLDQNKVIKNSFELKERKILIISGPNAGGKTVALKTVGLFVYLFHCAIPLPTDEEPIISYFNNIYVDIGDHQSLLDNLSTFSSHINTLREITSKVEKNSLVILDELGTGTSPNDGEALAIGIIEYLHEKDCFALITSHYEGLKSFSLENNYIIPSSMVFDEENLMPTYRLRIGTTGKSYGLEVSSRLGLDSKIIESARNYLENKKRDEKELILEELIQKLEETEQLKEQLLRREQELQKQIDETKNAQNALILEREKIHNNAQKEIESMIEEAERRIEDIIQEMKNQESMKMHHIISARHKLRELSDTKEEGKIERELQIDDYVNYVEMGIRGRIVRIKNDSCYILTDEGKSIWIPKNLLEITEKKQKLKQKVTTSDFINRKTVSLELNIVGYHVEEGLEAISKYLDDALVAHYKQVRIIHGSGTGTLRSAIHNYLNHHKHVESYRLGGLNEGGVGATVVFLK